MKMMKLAMLFIMFSFAQCRQFPDILHSYMKVHENAGTHTHPSVPSVIRGNNFTEDNLLKYFSYSAAETYIEPVGRSLLSVDVDQVMRIGKESWEFIKDNKPVVNSAVDYAGAVPSGVADWRSLAGWKNALSDPHTFTWVNGFDMETVHIDFKWAASYGGTYGGVGKYITQAGPVIGTIDVAWGYAVDVNVNALSPLNTGSADSPVAQIDTELVIRASTVLKDVTKHCRTRFTGSGSIKTISCNL